jgi:hypothetical protein
MKATLCVRVRVREKEKKKGNINNTRIASVISYLRSLTEIHLLPFFLFLLLGKKTTMKKTFLFSIVVVCLLLFGKCV